MSEAAPPAGPGEEPGGGRGEGRGDGGEPRRVVVTRRRAPRYRAFGVTGLVVGVVAGVTIALARPMPPDPGYTQRAIAGYFGTGLGMIGLLLGLAVALLVERRRG